MMIQVSSKALVEALIRRIVTKEITFITSKRTELSYPLLFHDFILWFL